MPPASFIAGLTRYTHRQLSALLALYPMARKKHQYCGFSANVASGTIVVAFALSFSAFGSATVFAKPAPANAPATSVLLDAMTAEMSRAMTDLGKTRAENVKATGDAQLPPYFLSYSAADVRSVNIMAQFGALVSSEHEHTRSVDVLVRVGDVKLDNTHGAHRASALTSTVALPLNDDRTAIERTLWWGTNEGYGNALHHYMQVKTETQVRAKEVEDPSPDFSHESPLSLDQQRHPLPR